MNTPIFPHSGDGGKPGAETPQTARVISMVGRRPSGRRRRPDPQGPIPSETFNPADHVENLLLKSAVLTHALDGLAQLVETSEVSAATFRPVQALAFELQHLAESLHAGATEEGWR